MARYEESGGSAISISTFGIFDRIVWGERCAACWTSGSNFYVRTPAPGTANPISNQVGKVVKMATTYAKPSGQAAVIKMYQDDVLVLTYETPKLEQWEAGNAHIWFGQRHGSVIDRVGYLDATILAAEVHNAVLTEAELKSRP